MVIRGILCQSPKPRTESTHGLIVISPQCTPVLTCFEATVLVRILCIHIIFYHPEMSSLEPMDPLTVVSGFILIVTPT